MASGSASNLLILGLIVGVGLALLVPFALIFTRELADTNEKRNIFFLWKEELYRYNIDDAKLEKIKDGIVFFDVTSSPNVIAYSQYDGGRNLGQVGLFDAELGTSRTVLENVPNLYTFDLSPDGKQILFGNQYYDLKTKKTMQIPDMFSGDSEVLPTWTARTSMGSRFVVYGEACCPRSLHEGAVYVTSLDGKSKEVLIAPSNDRPQYLVTSPSSSSLLVSSHQIVFNGTLSSLGKADMYRLDFAEPIPEFSSMVLFTISASMIGAILSIRRSLVIK